LAKTAHEGIARALAAHSASIVSDQPISSLDPSIQVQAINLLRGLRAPLDLTHLFISHDSLVVRHLSDDVTVMYVGRIVELGPGHKLARHSGGFLTTYRASRIVPYQATR
jgi:ABC-type oligopeptide transport system ATPase subunit